MSGKKILKFVGHRLIEIATGIVTTALCAYLFAPQAQVELGTIAAGVIAVPIFILLACVSAGLYSLFLIVRVIELIATKLDLFDITDGS